MARTAPRKEPLWKDLPKEVLEQHVLPFLPVASLCRFRAVSKKWNAQIVHPDFAALHAITSRAEDFAFINAHTNLPFNSLRGWEILDVAKDKVFQLSQGFLAAQGRPGNMDSEYCKVLASDGGLLLVWHSMSENSPDHALLVCNPVLKVVKVIPSLPGWVPAHAHRDNCLNCVVMSTDRASREYEIVVINPIMDHYQEGYQVECMDVFESKTRLWRRVRVVNPTPTVPSDEDFEERWRVEGQLVNFKSRLYRLYRRQSDIKMHLMAFDTMTGLVSVLPLPEAFFTVTLTITLELVVSQDRLFCLLRCNNPRHNEDNRLEIIEIFPEQHDFQLVARMPSYFLEWLGGYYVLWLMDARGNQFSRAKPIDAVGCASSILFCSCRGRVVRYNVLSNLWRRYSASNLLEEDLNFNGFGRFLGGYSNVGLSLCPALVTTNLGDALTNFE